MDEREKTDILKAVFDAMPSLIFVVDQDVRIQECNTAASDLLMAKRMTVLKHRAGEVLHCLHSTDVLEGCGRAPFCKDCTIRNSVTETAQGKRVVRRRTKLELIRDGNKIEIYALITTSPFTFKERPLVLLVIEDISEIAELQHIIPICAICKKIRNDKESWMRIEAYFKNYWDVDFSHGLCPDCYKIEEGKLKSYIKADQGTPADADKPRR